MFEFHVSRRARDLYEFDQELFSLNGNILFANFHAARQFAQKINDRRDLVRFPEQAVRAGQINAMGLIDEIQHLLVAGYRQQTNPQVMEQALAWLEEQVGSELLQETLRQFIDEFPPLVVYRQEIGADDYLAGESVTNDGQSIPNRQVVLEELLMLWLTNANPAFSPYLELFNDTTLEKHTAYRQVTALLHDFFDSQPFYGPDNLNLIDVLRKPAIVVPHSLNGQLDYIRTYWGMTLGKYLYQLLRGVDLIREEEKVVIGVGGGGPAQVIEFTGLEAEPEQFSQDRDWMPNLVLIAKNSYVWLDQLSKKYKRPITHLDEIPDEELEMLARRGFTGLWLIGLWERSLASQTIKQMRGNPEAVASAYSLMSYEVAADLGGEAAYQELRERAWKHGIRLGSDMVPNHMGIDSRWVVEHPEWFVALDYSPFPSYTFNGPNLSWDGRVGIFLEDHYYNNTDAAVVFKRIDHWAGGEKYIYHGNDGTSMPWNDTAQLNYLDPEVREAVIQTILHVARKFPIIRFDAAMTLAKRHYQRLWFPEPGSGGDIPSRAEQGLTKEQFNQAMPEEFWRQVVDRVAQEAPDTLLLAEAFWLMEGYFVRTLGMHRVYNSAFMHMLRDEKNQEYRAVIKNTLEFDPEILKRYVNFMSNPDERTAADQFGKGDKYFGVTALLATLPGLPMFGHGQVEGFTEKYGMEYRRAYWDEQVDNYFVERHEREIFPLLRQRYLFAEAANFLLYDFYTSEGGVNEDVYAYSNRAGGRRALVIYHNKYASARGWVRLSAAYPAKTGEGDERALVQKSLGEGLELQDDPDTFTIFRDHVTGLYYIHNSQELYKQGLYQELDAYQYHIYMDFQEVQDNAWHEYSQLTVYLNGRGVPSIDEALTEIFLQPVHNAFRELVNPGMIQWLIENRILPAEDGEEPATLLQVLDEVEQKLLTLLVEIKSYAGGKGDEAALASELRSDLEITMRLPAAEVFILSGTTLDYQEALGFLQGGPGGEKGLITEEPSLWGVLLAWLFCYKLGKVLSPTQTGDDYEGEVGLDFSEQSRTWLDEWFLTRLIRSALQGLDLDAIKAERATRLVGVLTRHWNWYETREEDVGDLSKLLKSWLKDSEVQSFLQVNRHQGLLWYNKEAFEELLWWLFVVTVVKLYSQLKIQTDDEAASEQVAEAISACHGLIERLFAAQERSGYQIEKLIEATERDL